MSKSSGTPVSDEDAGVSASASTDRQAFPRNARMRAKAEFDAVFARGRRIAAPEFVLHLLADGEAPRLGLAVSRKVDPNAVGRNRIKRVLRDAFRRQRAGLAPAAYVVVARAAAARARELKAAGRDIVQPLDGLINQQQVNAFAFETVVVVEPVGVNQRNVTFTVLRNDFLRPPFNGIGQLRKLGAGLRKRNDIVGRKAHGDTPDTSCTKLCTL